MAWIYLIISSGLLVGAAFFGWRTRHLKPGSLAVCLAGTGVLMGLRAFLYAHPEYEQHLLRLSDDYVYFATWEAPLAMLMAWGLAARLERGRLRRLVILSLFALAPLFLWDNVAACLQPSYAMPARFDADGVCRQSTSYSCGPAAAVMMLKCVGEDISEGEMANLCLLRPNKGVTALELCRGLNVALRGKKHRATIRRFEPDQLDRACPPFLAEVRRANATEHCVVVLQVGTDVVLLGDPARGRSVCPKDDFVEQWTGIAVTMIPSAAARPGSGPATCRTSGWPQSPVALLKFPSPH